MVVISWNKTTGADVFSAGIFLVSNSKRHCLGDKLNHLNDLITFERKTRFHSLGTALIHNACGLGKYDGPAGSGPQKSGDHAVTLWGGVSVEYLLGGVAEAKTGSEGGGD